MRLIVTAALATLLLPVGVSAQTTGFVYALVNNNGAANMIYGFSLDVGTGALTPLPGFPVPTGGTGSSLTPAESIEYDESQSRIYAINQGSNSVSVFDVNRATGAVSAAPFSPIAVSRAPGCIAINAGGTVLAVGLNDINGVSAFRIGTGSVVAAPGNPYSAAPAAPFSCAFSRDGGRFYTGGNVGSIMAGFSVNTTTAALAPLPGSPFEMGTNFPIGYAVDAAERLFATGFVDHLARAYSIAGGPPVALGATADTGQLGPVHGLLHPFGFYVTTARTNNTVAVLRISGLGSSTLLTPAPGSPFATGGLFSNATILDASGQIAITSNGNSRNLTTFRFNAATGAMTLAVVQSPNSLGPTGAVIGLAFAARNAPPTTPAFPPTITPIPNQNLPLNGSVTVPFTIGGAILTSVLQVSLASSNAILLPVSASTLRSTCVLGGACALFIQPADGRFGTSLVTATVSDGFFSTSTSFTVTVAAGAPTAPTDVLSTPVGSGFVVTWNPPLTGTPLGYAVAWGTANGASNLPVQLLPFNRFEVTAAPPGTYFLRVYAVGQGQMSPASFQTQVIVTSSPSIPGPPLGLEATADAQSLTGTWRAPQQGGAPSIYEVQVGTGVGLNNVASPTTATLSQRTPVPAGSYWIRSRAAAGGNAGPWTSSVQIPVAPGPCTSAPGVPTMLPVTTTTGLVTFNWVAFGATAERFEVELATGLGLPAIVTLPTTGPGSSLVWPHTGSGTGAARVVAINSCGRSARSNEVGFTLQ